MSQNISISNTLCDGCVHQANKRDNGNFDCRLLEEELIKAKLECDDFEEKIINEDSAYECD
jgi:hypothetical protein